MKKIIITLFCLLILPMLVFAQDTPKEDGVNLFKSTFEAFCGTNNDVGKLVKNERFEPLFATKTSEKAYIIFTNPQTHHWALILFPIARPDIACIAGAGEGFATDNRKSLDGQKAEY